MTTSERTEVQLAIARFTVPVAGAALASLILAAAVLAIASPGLNLRYVLALASGSLIAAGVYGFVRAGALPQSHWVRDRMVSALASASGVWLIAALAASGGVMIIRAVA